MCSSAAALTRLTCGVRIPSRATTPAYSRRPTRAASTITPALEHLTRGGVPEVFWQEGTLVCVLVDELPAADVRALAVAKAMTRA